MEALVIRIQRASEAVRRGAEVQRDTVASRNALIIAAFDAGYSYGQIAAAAGLRRHTVMEIVSNQNIARQEART